MRFEKQRIALITWIVRWVIIPLVGRGVQVIRQDERSGDRGSWLHHAPRCGANHYHHARPITTRCTCGAEASWRSSQSSLSESETITNCRTEEGITVGLIDAVITIARIIKIRDLSNSKAVREALKDLASDDDFAFLNNSGKDYEQ